MSSYKKPKVKEEKSILASGFIPTEPEEINAQWLFEVINQYREVKNLSLLKKPDDILECEINERLNSRGYLSSTYIINCKFKVFTSFGMEESDYSFFIKMFPSSHIYSNERGKYLAKRTNAFQREIETNFCFLRRLSLFAEEANTKNSSTKERGKSQPINTPDIVYGSHDEEGNGVIVWMDATATHGFQPTNHCKGLSLTQLLCVVETLADFHAASVAFLLKNENRVEQDFPFLSRGVDVDKFANDEDFDGGLNNSTNDGGVGKEQERLIQEMMPVFKDFSRFIRKVPGHIDAFKSWERHRPMAPGTVIRSSRRAVKPPLRAIIHGELWEKNILFHRKRFAGTSRINGNVKRGSGKRKVFQNGQQRNSYQQPSDNSDDDEDDEDEASREMLKCDEDDNRSMDQKLPYNVMLTDWKYSGIGSPTDDLAMLLLSSISGSKRQKYTKDILKRYHSSLLSKLKTCHGVDVTREFPDYDYATFLKCYDQSLIGAFLKTVSIMTVEIKNLEADFIYIKEECVEEKDKAGLNLRVFGRRLLNLADEFVPKKVNSSEWKKFQMKLKASEMYNNSGKVTSGLRTPTGLRNKISGSSSTNSPNSHISITKPESLKIPTLRV